LLEAQKKSCHHGADATERRPRAASLLNMPNGMLRSQHKKNMAGENYTVGQNLSAHAAPQE
jgi:hypothetical protein